MHTNSIKQVFSIIGMLRAIDPEGLSKASGLVSNHLSQSMAANAHAGESAHQSSIFGRKQLLRELHLLLRELRTSGSLRFEENRLIDRLVERIPEAPTEAEVELELSELRVAKEKHKRLEEDVIVNSHSYPRDTEGFDAGYLVRLGNHPKGPQYLADRIENIVKNRPEVERLQRVILSNRAIQVVEKLMLEILPFDPVLIAWNLIIIVRIHQREQEKRGAGSAVERMLKEVEGVEEVQWLRAWDTGFGWTHIWTASGRELIQGLLF